MKKIEDETEKSDCFIKPYRFSKPIRFIKYETMLPTGTQIAYFHLCHRKLWLHIHHIRMENTSNNVYVEEGKLIDETTYQRKPTKWRNLDLGHVKIDHYDPVNNIIHEVKKSSKLEKVHIAQVQYYIYTLHQYGITHARGVLLYPKLKRRLKVTLSIDEFEMIENWINDIRLLAACEKCPPVIKKRYCTSCAFRDFCYV